MGFKYLQTYSPDFRNLLHSSRINSKTSSQKLHSKVDMYTCMTWCYRKLSIVLNLIQQHLTTQTTHPWTIGNIKSSLRFMNLPLQWPQLSNPPMAAYNHNIHSFMNSIQTQTACSHGNRLTSEHDPSTGWCRWGLQTQVRPGELSQTWLMDCPLC